MPNEPPGPKAVTCVTRDGVSIIQVDGGDLDLYTSADLQKTAADVVARGCLVVIDLTRTTFVDMHALGVLNALLRRIVEAQGAMSIAYAYEKVHATMAAAHLPAVLPVCDGVDAAIAAVKTARVREAELA